MFDIRFGDFVIQLLGAVFLFTVHLEWRENGKRRYLLMAALLLLFSTNTIVFNPMFDTGMKKGLYYFIIIGGLITGIHYCYRAAWEEAVVIGAAAYTSHHFAYDVFMLLLSILGIGMDDIAFRLPYYALVVVVYVFSYLLLYWFFSRNVKISKEKINSGFRWIVLSIGALFLDVAFNIFFIHGSSWFNRK